jgi:hypothetical protein
MIQRVSAFLALLMCAGCASSVPITGFSCGGLSDLIRADRPRLAVLYFPRNLDPGLINFYASMHASPLDDAARAFYGANRQSTHYVALTEIGDELGQCLRQSPDTARVLSRGRARTAVLLKNGREVRLEASTAACSSLPEGAASEDECLVVEIVDPEA